MYFLGIQILIFILIHKAIASTYYYKKGDKAYDVYYGPNAIWGYKEFKSPKSYKVEFEDRGDRSGKCSAGSFQCKAPYQVKETSIFECDTDYQCPRYFKCCQVTCFQHKICQPAITDDEDENEIPTYDQSDQKSTEIYTEPSIFISTSSEIQFSTNFKTAPTAEMTTRDHVTTRQSDLRSTTEATSLNIGTTNMRTAETLAEDSSTLSVLPTILTTIPQKSQTTTSETAYSTGKTSETFSTLSLDLETDKPSIISSLKPDTATTGSEKTQNIPTSQITEKLTERPSSVRPSDFSTEGNKNEDITTDDEDLNFSGDEELDTSIPDEDVDGTTSSVKPRTKPISTSSETTLSKTSPSGDETTVESLKTSTLQSSTGTRTQSEHTIVSATTSSTISNLGETAEDASPSTKFSTLVSHKETTKLSDITDDEELTFSGDYEMYPDDKSVSSSTETEPVKTFSTDKSSTATIETTIETSNTDQNGLSTNIKSTQSSSLDVTTGTTFKSSTESKFTELPSSLVITTESFTSTKNKQQSSSADESEPNESTQMANSELSTGTSSRLQTITPSDYTGRDVITDDEDLAFSGDDELDTSTLNDIASTSYTQTNAPTIAAKPNVELTTDITATESLKPSTISATTTENPTKSNTQDVDDEDNDMIFSGDGEVKLTTDTFRGSTKLDFLTESTPEILTLPGNGEKSTNHEEDFSFSDNDNILSTQTSETTTENKVQSEMTTKVSTESDRKSSTISLSETTYNHGPLTTTLNTKLTTSTLPNIEIEDQTTLLTDRTSRRQTDTTTDNINISTRSSDDNDDIPYSTSESMTTSTEITSNEADRSTIAVSTTTEGEGQTTLFTERTIGRQTDETTDNADMSTRSSDDDDGSSYSTSESVTTSTEIINNEADRSTLAESTTINSNNEKLPYGTGIIFINGLLEMLRKVPKTAIVEASNDKDVNHYFNNFLALLGKLPNLVKDADADNFIVNERENHYTQDPTIISETES